jgi:hypothetical protein
MFVKRLSNGFSFFLKSFEVLFPNCFELDLRLEIHISNIDFSEYCRK